MVQVKISPRLLGSALLATTALLAGAACAHVDVVPRVLAPDPAIAPCRGITVAVDGRALSGTGNGGYADPQATCVRTDQPMTARAAFDAAGVTLTRASEDATAVCRVDGEPFDGLAIARPGGGIHVETCTSTPPDFARWVVWARPPGEDGWSDAHQDIATLDLSPGAGVALVYAYRGEPSSPRF